MTVPGSLTADRHQPSVRSLLRGVGASWPLAVGLLAMAIPTIYRLARDPWTSDIGAHGPIVLATGLWLIAQCWTEVKGRRTSPSMPLLVAGLAVALLFYVFGRAYDFISIETAGVYLTGVVMIYRLFGWGGIKAALFPLIYLAFVVPPPGWVLDALTSPLREFVSMVATHILQALGYPIAREGVALTIAQYQLLVEDACSGMNSIVGLSAIAIFYIYVVHRASWRYALLLLALVIPVAIFVNLLRVMTLILLTYYAGDGVAQGFMHVTTGLVLFVVALVVIFALDMAIRRLFLRGKARLAEA